MARLNHSPRNVGLLDSGEAGATRHHVARGMVRRTPHGRVQARFPGLIDAEPPALRPPLEHFHPDWTRRGLCHCEERSDAAIPCLTSRWPLCGQGIAASLRSSQ